jgi:sarcosine oxidase, subunit delta
MLLIPCPHCGPRPEVEFRCGGEAHVARPDPAVATDAAWADYLFFRKNPRGPLLERWLHASGCGRWFNAARDSTTDAILATYPAGEQPSAAIRERLR